MKNIYKNPKKIVGAVSRPLGTLHIADCDNCDFLTNHSSALRDAYNHSVDTGHIVSVQTTRYRHFVPRFSTELKK
jgi:hypothetical protein